MEIRKEAMCGQMDGLFQSMGRLGRLDQEIFGNLRSKILFLVYIY